MLFSLSYFLFCLYLYWELLLTAVIKTLSTYFCIDFGKFSTLFSNQFELANPARK